MVKSSRVFTLLLLVTAFSGCAIHQNVKPVERFDDKQICIIEKPAVKPGFLETYSRVLNRKGYVVKQLPPSASLVDCPVTSTYNARWKWDLALYMALAEIMVYKNGKPIGEATYDSLSGDGTLSKFVDAENKITELVNQLFPGDMRH